MQAALPHVVIVGGGFGGLWATRALDGAPVRITLIDRHNHHLFQPLLYQVAKMDELDYLEPFYAAAQAVRPFEWTTVTNLTPIR